MNQSTVKMILITLLLITPCIAVNLEFLQNLLSGNLKEIYNLNNPREAIIESVSVLKKIALSNNEKTVIWGAFKGLDSPQNLTADDLSKISDLLNIIPEHDLCDLNLTDWTIVEILGKVGTFSRGQVAIIANSLKIKHGLKSLTRADSLNKLSGLICGLSEDDLSKIAKHDFKKINSRVFSNLKVCSDSQLRVLLDKSISLYGAPQTWPPRLLRHIGMLILSLNKQEILSLQPASLQYIEFDMIKTHKPELINDFTPEQLKNLSHPHANDTLKSSSHASNIQEICFFVVLFLRAYLLLKF